MLRHPETENNCILLSFLRNRKENTLQSLYQSFFSLINFYVRLFLKRIDSFRGTKYFNATLLKFRSPFNDLEGLMIRNAGESGERNEREVEGKKGGRSEPRSVSIVGEIIFHWRREIGLLETWKRFAGRVLRSLRFAYESHAFSGHSLSSSLSLFRLAENPSSSFAKEDDGGGVV